jgi:hypothetical protein
MDRFVKRENIVRYRGLASESTTAIERLRILRLLAEERAKFKLEFQVAATVRASNLLSPKNARNANEP